MKCRNCHAELTNGVCDMCGFDSKEFDKTTKKIGGFVNGAMRLNGIIKLLSFLVIVLMILSIIFPIMSLATVGIGELISIIIMIVVKVFSVAFVGWISVKLISTGLEARKNKINSDIVDGVIVESKNQKEVFIGGKGFIPIVEYEVYGKKYRVVGFTSNKKKYEKGSIRKVRYNRENPIKASLADENNTDASLVLGIFLFVVCIVVTFLL